MPEFNNQFLIFALIFLAVPLQMFLTHSNSSEARYALLSLVTDVKRNVDLYAPDFVREWLARATSAKSAVDEDGEVVDATAETTEMKYFGQSMEPRYPRPPFVKYRVGQVVKHTIHGYRGVIIGWDETAKAPEKWLTRNHGKNKEWRDLPNYTVAIDTRDRVTPQIAYVVEVNLEPSKNQVFHPLVKHYFESFDGSRYSPRPMLKEAYPDD